MSINRLYSVIALLTAFLQFGAGEVVAQKTVFQTSFEYANGDPIVFEPIDLNGADGQVGLWSGLEFPPTQGEFPEDRAVLIDNPYGGQGLLIDRPSGDDGLPERTNVDPRGDFTGSYFADLSEAVLLQGAEVSFELGSRRFSSNDNKSYSIIGRDSHGAESFHLRVSTNNNPGVRRRLGVVTDEGNTVSFDLPTVVGDDADNDLEFIAPPFSVNHAIASIKVLMRPAGYTIDFSHNPQRSYVNAYVTNVIPYNGAGVDLAQVEFTYEASRANGRNSGTFLDNVLVTGFTEILVGDFNGDGVVDIADFMVMANNFRTGTTPEEGDINLDNEVNLLDFVEFKAIFNAQGADVTAVPESGSLGILGLGALLLVGRWRGKLIRRPRASQVFRSV